MAHPYKEHRAHKKSRSRVGHVMKSGGQAHSDAAADKKLFKQLIAQHEASEHDVPGHAKGGRVNKYARGGAAKRKHHAQVNIAIVTPHGGHPSGVAPGGPMVPPPRPPLAAPAGGPPPVLPPGGPAGGPPGLIRPPMKRGGRIKMTAGADSGEGRLEKAHKYNAKGR